MNKHFLKLCHAKEIADSSALGFDPLEKGADTIFVVRQGKALYAYVNDCPHWPGSPMAWKKHAYLTSDKTHINCYGHNALFDIETGNCISGPCIGQSLTSIELTIDRQQVVHISVENLL